MTSFIDPQTVEHYVTFFDHRFLLQGLALYDSLQRNQSESLLWVLCLDPIVEDQLRQLKLPRLVPLALKSFETPALLSARENRSRVEYIFTLTPFTFDFVFSLDRSVRRVTYVDADMLFFKDPWPLFESFHKSGRSVLITEHGYAPEYSSLLTDFGRFCVQFLTVRRDSDGLRVIQQWQSACLESCSIAAEDREHVYGDQKHLDDWPEKYPTEVFISPEAEEMWAPWNANYRAGAATRSFRPVFYHFHSFRIFHPGWVQLCAGFNLRGAEAIYRSYFETLLQQADVLRDHGIPCPFVPFSNDRWWLPRLAWRLVGGRARVRRFS